MRSLFSPVAKRRVPCARTPISCGNIPRDIAAYNLSLCRADLAGASHRSRTGGMVMELKSIVKIAADGRP